MKRSTQGLAALFFAAAGLWLLAGRGDAGGATGPWQPILSKEAFQELANREVEIIKGLLEGKADEDAVARAKVGAVLLASYTMSSKDPGSEQLRGVRERAMQLAWTLERKDGLADAKKLLAGILAQKTNPQKAMAIEWNKPLTAAILMDHFRPKDKHGDGIHADLQSNIRLKGALNGIEEKIRALSMKELPAAGMKKEAKELELFGLRTAVVGSLTHEYVPPTTKKHDPKEWRDLSLRMRDSGVALAAAAQKSDIQGVFKASNALNSACSQCHGSFRN